MKIIVFDKEKIKEKRILDMYKLAIDMFTFCNHYENIVLDITSYELKKYLSVIYELYESKNIIKYYQNDIKIYLINVIDQVKQTNNIITSDCLLDSLVCPLYEKRVNDIYKNTSKEKIITINRGEKYGRKYN